MSDIKKIIISICVLGFLISACNMAEKFLINPKESIVEASSDKDLINPKNASDFFVGLISPSPAKEEIQSNQQITPKTFQYEPIDIWENTLEYDPNAKKIELQDLVGSGNSVKAYLSIDNGFMYHALVADFKEIDGQGAYQGWLISRYPRIRYVSTGLMHRTKKGQYVLKFNTSDPVVSSFSEVGVSFEPSGILQKKPTRIVFNGTF